MLSIKDLKVNVEDKEILKGLSLDVEDNKVHVLMGPNGSGKSTLAHALMGNPKFEVVSGEVSLDGKDVLEMEPDERSHEGLFMSFQYPSEIPGVTISNFLRLVYMKKNNIKITPVKFRKLLKEKMELLKIDESFMSRYLNEGFSGGEKKRMEMLQMVVLEPKVALLDETDSGLDIDSLKMVAESVQKLKEETGMSVLLITHYTRILQHIEPDVVHIMKDGKIVKTGGKDLAHELEAKGYEPFVEENE